MRSIPVILFIFIFVILTGCASQQGLVGKATAVLPASSFSITSSQPILAHSDLTFTFSPPNTNIWAVYQKVYLSSKTNPEQNGWRAYTAAQPTLNPSPGWLFIVPSRGINIIKGTIAIPEDLPAGTYTFYLATYEWTNNKWTSIKWAKKEITTLPSNYCPIISESKCVGDKRNWCNQQNLWQQYACPKSCYQPANTNAYCKECNNGENQCKDITTLQECVDYKWRESTCDLTCSSGACVTLPAITEPTETDFSTPAEEAQAQPIQEKLCNNYEFEKIVGDPNITKNIPGFTASYDTLDAPLFRILPDGKIILNLKGFNKRSYQPDENVQNFQPYAVVLLDQDGKLIKNISKPLFGYSPTGNLYFTEKHPSRWYQNGYLITYTSDLNPIGSPWLMPKLDRRELTDIKYPAKLDNQRNIYTTGVDERYGKQQKVYLTFNAQGTHISSYPEFKGIFIILDKDGFPIMLAEEKYEVKNFHKTFYLKLMNFSNNGKMELLSQRQLIYTSIREAAGAYSDGIITFKLWAGYIVALEPLGISIFNQEGKPVRELLQDSDPMYTDYMDMEGKDMSKLYGAADFAFDSEGNLYTLMFHSGKGGYLLNIRKYRCVD